MANDGSVTVAKMFGEITWLLTQSRWHKHFSLGDLEWMVMTPLLLEQFRIFYGDDAPLGFCVWAFLSAEVERSLVGKIDEGHGIRMRPDEWKSGEKPWLIELVVPFATSENKLKEVAIADLKKSVFFDREFSFVHLNEDGKMLVSKV